MKVQSGNVKADIDGFDFIDQLLKTVAPNAKREIETQLNNILEEARAEWPVRKSIPITEEGKFRATARAMLEDRKDWSGFKQALAAAHNLRDLNRLRLVEVDTTKSQDSKGKLKIGIKMDAQGQIVAFIENTAPYAWAIKVGKDTDTTLPLGARVSNELLFKPMKKASNIVAQKLADDMK